MKFKGILYLDDEQSNLNVFKATFKYDYDIFTSNNYQEALKILDNNKVWLVISDQRMPDITGIEFLKQVREKYPDIIGIILTAYTDIDVVIEAFTECNIFRYVTKPWDSNELKLTLENAQENYALKINNKALVEQLKATNVELERKVEERTKELVLANNVKSKIFSYISGELGKHISYFSGFLDLLMSFENAVDLEKSKKYANKISDSILNVNALLEKLYRWATIELDKSGPKLQKCIVNNFVNSNIETLRIPALRRKISINWERDSAKVSVLADSSILNFMLSNLILSAVQVGEEYSNIEVGVHRDNGHGTLKLSGSSKKMSDYINWANNREDGDDIGPEYDSFADSELSFMILNEYLKKMKGNLELAKSEEGFDYDVCFHLPTSN